MRGGWVTSAVELNLTRPRIGAGAGLECRSEGTICSLLMVDTVSLPRGWAAYSGGGSSGSSSRLEVEADSGSMSRITVAVQGSTNAVSN